MTEEVPVVDKEVEAMNRSLDRIYAETDRDVRELNVSQEEWSWAREKYKAFMARVVEIEDTLVYEMGREKFVDLLGKWQKNVRHIIAQIKKQRTEPFQ